MFRFRCRRGEDAKVEELEGTQEQYFSSGSIYVAGSDAFYFTKLWGRTGRTVSRQGEGEPTESRTFTYETADGESQQIDLEVHPVERENAEVQQLLEQAVEEWEAVFLGENKSENEITGNLVLENTFCDGLVQAVYESSDYTVIQDDGTVANEQVGEDGVIVTLQAEFSYADISRTRFGHCR